MIQTKRLHLIPCEKIHLEAFARCKADLAALLQVSVPGNWPTFPEAFALPDESSPIRPSEWPSCFFIDVENKALIGNGGFVWAPDADGNIEIGYEIAPEYWNKGYATEAAQGMVDYAFSHADVKAVIAHTLGEPNASNSVLKKTGMTFANEIKDEEHGSIWQWRIKREDYSPTK